MTTKGLGVMMAFLGVGSFVLPWFGLQFKILTIFGSYQWLVSLALIVIGIVLLIKRK